MASFPFSGRHVRLPARAVRPRRVRRLHGGFGARDTIDLGTIGYSAAATSSFVAAPGGTSGTLIVANDGHAAHPTLLGSYVRSNVVLSADGAAGTPARFG